MSDADMAKFEDLMDTAWEKQMHEIQIREVLAKEHSPIGFPVWFTFVAVTSQCIESAA